MTAIRILFVFGRIVVAVIRYLAEYFESLFGTALVFTGQIT